MLQFTAALFDFDGTLIDSASTIMASIQTTLTHFGRAPFSEAQLRACVGPPIHHYFQEMLGFREEELDSALAVYRHAFDEHAVTMLRPFAGAKELLRDVQAKGVRVGVASCKMQSLCIKQAAQFGFTPYIDFIGGSIPEENLYEKSDIIRHALSALQAAPTDAVMIGDRMYDLIGANEAGVRGIGVLYGGCGTREELEAHNPLYIAEDINALRALLLPS
ncbi:HAD hydrolase-like protein [Christensenellaceae bacterium OttesenSCG-928-L17]|nr:HAD hydrolase-like protein [Christensenellaceae bacterium OttesenSCG-928-L17]